LFLATLVQALLEQGVLQEHAGCWTVQAELVTRAGEIPEGLRQLLERQLTRLAHRLDDPIALLNAHSTLGIIAF
jgi:hypothetical protein